jgi:hypothetical protein
VTGKGKFRIVFWDESSLMMEAVRTSETSVDNYFTRQYIPEDNSELHTRRCENLKSHTGRDKFVSSGYKDNFLTFTTVAFLCILYVTVP